MKKNVVALLAAVVVAASSLTSCANKNTGKVVNIRVWNTEFIERFAKFYDKIDKTKTISDTEYLLTDGTKVVFTVTANDNNGYQNALDEALKNQETAALDDKVDMFLMEADYALKYANSDFTLDVKNDVGLTDTDVADMYDYTKTVVTDTRSGKGSALKGVSWQATPGLYAYRTDLAEDCWGDSSPEFVQEKLKDWDSFNTATAEMKAKNHYMLSGYDDAYRVYSNNATNSWVNSSGVVTLDPQIKAWIKATKNYSDNKYNHGTTLWKDGWVADQGPTGNVFGFFYSTWGINFTLLGNSLADAKGDKKVGNGLYGKYRVCQGPASWYWGGTWLSACKGSDNLDTVKDIMKVMTCDKATAKNITKDTEDYTNNKTAMHELATDSTYGSAFLGGQNHIALFEESAKNIHLAPMSAYDQGCNEKIQTAMRDYFTGTVTYEKAIANFKSSLNTVYSGLTYDATFDAAIDA